MTDSTPSPTRDQSGPPVLAEDVRSRIEAEETYREEVRRDLQARRPAESRPRTLWGFLNSTFVLWFLSSVVIGGLTAAVTGYEHKRADDARKADLQGRLNREIGYRVAGGLDGLVADKRRIDLGRALSPLQIYNEGLDYLDNHVFYREFGDHGDTKYVERVDWSLYSEYRDRTFRALLYELRSVADSSMQPALREADAGYRKLESLTTNAQVAEEAAGPAAAGKGAQAGTTNDAETVLATLQKLQSYPMWRNAE